MGKEKNNHSPNGWHPQDEDDYVDYRYIHEDDYEDYGEYEEYEDDEQPPFRRPSHGARRPYPRTQRSYVTPERDIPASRPSRQPAPQRTMRRIPPARKRRTWPTLLTGCVIGVLLVVAILAALVILGLNAVQNGGHLSGIPGLPGLKTYTRTSSQDVALSQLSQIQVCDKIGNVTLKVDPIATKTTVSALKTVQATSDSAAQTLLQQMTVAVQSPSTTATATGCPTEQSSGNNSTPVTNTTTLTSTSTTAASTLMITVALPQVTNNQVDLTVTLPPAAIQSAQTALALSVNAPRGNIDVTGISGDLKLLAATGNVTVRQAIITDGTQIETSQGNITFNGYLLVPPDSQNTTNPPRYLIRNETGNIDISLPANTNVTLDANTNIGAIKSDFAIPVNNNGGPVNYHGALNPALGTTALATLVLDVSTGNVHIQKATQLAP
ncbi:DUF4097 domain-containing protein [Dictyobacter arantiisoli]|uniref:Adhesin domain-containing protein n=1 Tax=Dictyobacter arantiisoli TaxID=2014874 RepID=A0A5A5TCF4_9CHLR|nr:DUF4097 domain-containing protein [Dictyobacter arantiisoli]GCF09017.1 hypothetical protein KDI_25810 [Dictyobacter arantiisoli]